MGNVKPDVVLKDFWRENHRFADLFKGVCFHGKEILQPDSLEELDTEVSGIIQMKDYKETLTRARDVVKKMAGGVEFVIFAEENQHRIHYAMPLRNMLYDAMGYLKECQEITRKHRSSGEKLAKDEFLSRLRKGDRLHPIISLTIYYGEADWDGPRSLCDMIVDMPEEIQAVFSDYPMHLLEVRDSGKYLFHNREVEAVFEISREAMAGHFDRIQEKYRDTPVSSELLTVIGTMIHSKELQAIGESKEVENMFTAIEKWEQEKLEKGIEKGIEEGRILLIRNLIVNGMSDEDIRKYAKVTDQEIQKAKELSES